MSVPHHIDWFEGAQSFDELSRRLSGLAADIDDNFTAVDDQATKDRGNQVTLGDDLTALKNLTGTGIVVRTADGDFAVRTLQAGTDISISDGDGVSADPTITSTAAGGGSSLPDPVTVAHGGTGATDASTARTNLGLAIGTDVQAFDADLSAVAGLASTGLIARTGAGTVAARTLVAGSGILITDGDGVSGSPVIAASASSVNPTEGSQGSTDSSDIFTDPWLVYRHRTRNYLEYFRDLAQNRAVNCTFSQTGSTSSVNDARASWIRHFTAVTLAAAAGGRATNSTSGFFWLDHEPMFMARIKVIHTTDIRLFVGLWARGQVPDNVDTPQTKNCLGFRFSSVSGDTKFVPIVSDGTTQTNGTPIGTIGANEEYLLLINVYNAGASARMIVVRKSDWSVEEYTMTIPSALLGDGFDPIGVHIFTQGAFSREAYISRFSVEWGLLS